MPLVMGALVLTSAIDQFMLHTERISTLAGRVTNVLLSGPTVNPQDGATMFRERKRVKAWLDQWQRREDLFARCPWSNLALWVYTAAWLIAEKGIIGWDGWATVIALDVALSIRRHQGKNK